MSNWKNFCSCMFYSSYKKGMIKKEYVFSMNFTDRSPMWMTKQHNEESQPLVQVTDSLLDAIGLLTSLLEEQAYKPSVDLLITIVEGMESVFKILPMRSEERRVGKEFSCGWLTSY